jgi:hypothetical protein
MVLGQKAHTAGDTIRYIVDYTRWLEDGVSLKAATITLASGSPFDVTLTDVEILTESNRVAFVVSGGSVNEIFTADVQATDTRDEVKNDTISFRVIAP